MIESGYLIIADLSGYTHFLKGSELDHAQEIMEDLFAAILGQLEPPLFLSNIQGDAFFLYSPDSARLARSQIMDSLEALYFGFRTRLNLIVANTTCRCRACSNAAGLDMKFIVHHGEYAAQEIANRRELAGPDVILLHRLLKNDIVRQTGISSYAFFTSSAAGALGLDELKSGVAPYATDIEEFGTVTGKVADFGSRWDEYHRAHEIVVADEELWFDPITRLVPASVEYVWEAYCNVGIIAEWNTEVDEYTRISGDPSRLRNGSVDHCSHGGQDITMRFIDVRPLRHLTVELVLPFNGRARWTVQFSPENGSTRIAVKMGKASASTALATALLRISSNVLMKKKVHRLFCRECELLEEFFRKKGRAGIPAGNAARSLSRGQIAKAARAFAGRRKAAK